MTLTKEATGLCTCGFCQDDKRYTPTGLNAHLEKVHGKHLCPRCGADLSIWPFTTHNCDNVTPWYER
jgi:uncharacterized protein CbrC (UPF0167 family)